jgi:hypothetical protein
LQPGLDGDGSHARDLIGEGQEVRSDDVAVEHGHHAGVIRTLDRLGKDHGADFGVRDVPLHTEAVVKRREGAVADVAKKRDPVLGCGNEFEFHARPWWSFQQSPGNPSFVGLPIRA